MSNVTAIALSISLLLNILVVLIVILALAKKGGFSYLISKLSVTVKQNSYQRTYYSPYYLHRQSQFGILPNLGSEIIFLGDSITNEGEWIELLGNPDVKNRGISGDTTDGILARLATIVASQPRQIFLMVGINDLVNRGRSVEATLKNYQKILSTIRDSTPNTAIFIQSTLPINPNLFKFFSGKRINEKVVKLNNNLRELAKESLCYYINLFPHLVDAQNQLDAKYTLDGIHLNGQAYLVWRQAIAEYIIEPSADRSL